VIGKILEIILADRLSTWGPRLKRAIYRAVIRSGPWTLKEAPPGTYAGPLTRPGERARARTERQLRYVSDAFRSTAAPAPARPHRPPKTHCPCRNMAREESRNWETTGGRLEGPPARLRWPRSTRWPARYRPPPTPRGLPVHRREPPIASRVTQSVIGDL